jgi:RecB family endonuclease NucS
VSERVFTVTGSAATAAQPITLAEAGLRERSDLQEWVLSHPEIIGDDVLVVTFEFDRWQVSGGARERDRLDVLGIGADGRLVVAELKRDRAPDTVEMQAGSSPLTVGGA